jgi:hypothetical protein
MRGPLNLATRPVRNERLPALLFGLAAFALLLVTLQHAFVAYRLMPRRSNALREEVASLERELGQIEIEATSLSRIVVAPAQKTEWAVIKELVDRRVFWWSRLFATFEEMLPRDARITGVAPRISKEKRLELEMTVRLQNANAGYGLMRLLERHPAFSDVRNPRNESMSGEYEFIYVMRYEPLASESAVPKPTAAPAAPEAAPAPPTGVEL